MEPVSTSQRYRKIETAVYYGFFFLFVGLCFYSSFFVKPLPDPNNLNQATLHQVIFGFGFNRLQCISPVLLINICLIILAGMVILLNRSCEIKFHNILTELNNRFFKKKLFIAIACFLFLVVCCLFQSNMVSADMVIYESWIPRQFHHGVMHVRFDEMWESNLHFNAYILLNTFSGMNVLSSYRLLSCLAAPFFLYLLLQLNHRLVPNKALPLTLLVMSGGFVQLFFGDMEYYTISITLVIAYFYLAFLYLQGETSFIVPAMVLGLAMTFHMETLIFLPTLFFLSIFAVQRREAFHVVAGWIGLFLLISSTLLFFVINGASLTNLVNTSWGLGRDGNVLANFQTNTDFIFISRLNMITLVFPCLWLLPIMLFGGRFKLEPFNGFLLVGASFGIPFSLLWVSSIGLYSDWNLFSMPLFPAILLVAYNLIQNVHIGRKTALCFAMTSFCMLLSYGWIISNHFIVR